MKQFNANPKHLRAAQLFQAKDDIRYYLNGVFLDKERGAIYGTNGHCIISITADWVKGIPESMIINLEQAVPATATNAAVTMVNDNMGFIEFTLKRTVKRVFFDVIDGTFPDIKKLFAEKIKKPKKQPYFCMNPEYLVKCQKAFGILSGVTGGGVIVETHGLSEALQVTYNHPANLADEVVCLVMPVRRQER